MCFSNGLAKDLAHRLCFIDAILSVKWQAWHVIGEKNPWTEDDTTSIICFYRGRSLQFMDCRIPRISAMSLLSFQDLYDSNNVAVQWSNTPVRLDGDHPRPYGDRQTWTQCEKNFQKITSLKKAALFTATCAIIPRSHDAVATTSSRLLRFYWDLWAWQRRSPAIPRRSHHARGVLTMRLVRVPLLHGDLGAFLPRCCTISNC